MNFWDIIWLVIGIKVVESLIKASTKEAIKEVEQEKTNP